MRKQKLNVTILQVGWNQREVLFWRMNDYSEECFSSFYRVNVDLFPYEDYEAHMNVKVKSLLI